MEIRKKVVIDNIIPYGVLINDENEGTFEGVLLIIGNSQRISKLEVTKTMKQILKYRN